MSALVASLFAVGASPAAAIDDKSKPDHPAGASACVGPARNDYGFTDLGTLEAAVPNINCLAYYGISAGRTADTFDPNANVRRSEMALFLHKAASLAGIDLSKGDMSADFGDIAELGDNRQAAIKALARNGIMEGRGDMAFEPNADITRAEMAMALVSLVDHVSDTVTVAKSGANKGLYVFGSAPGALPNDNFTDVVRTKPRHVNNAVSAAYELGITSGKSLDVFDPDGTVPRRNMATFIMNALAHTNLRPAGLTAQRTGTTIEVSVRDAEFKPVPNAHIDAFSAPTAAVDNAFNADGTCRKSQTRLVDGATACQIDGSDPITQTNGNTTLAAVTDVGDGRTVWIWTGDFGDKYDNDDTSHITVDVPKGASDPVPAEGAVLSNDLPKQPDAARSDVTRVRFGATVTVTIQLESSKGVKASPPSGNPVKYNVKRTHRFVDEYVDPTADPRVPVAIPSPVTEAFFTGTSTSRYKSDEPEMVTIGPDGSAEFTVTTADINANRRGDRTIVKVEVSQVTTGDVSTVDLAVTDYDAATTTGDGILYFVFSDEAARVASLAIETNGSQVAPGSSSVGNAVTVSVTDQFGNPAADKKVALFSSDETCEDANPICSSIPQNPKKDGPREYTTLRTGKVRIGYTYKGGASQEHLVAIWNANRVEGDTTTASNYGAEPISAAGVVACQEETAGNDVCSVSTKVNWVRPFTGSTTGTDALAVLSLDADNDEIVFDGSDTGVDPMSVNYDSNDSFVLVSPDGDDDGTDDDVNPVSLADFEAALAKALKDSADSTTQFPTVKVSSYVSDDSSDIASFEVDVTIDQ